MTINKIKFNTAEAHNAYDQRRVFLVVSGIFLALLSLYVFFVSRTVFNIIERKSAESEMRALSSSLSTLEVEYMSLSKNIDLSLASSLGFNESKNIYFASRRTSVGSLINKADEL
jgi:hypothetical protein